MPEPLKNIYNAGFFDQMTDFLQQVYPSFDSTAFLGDIYDNEWESRELKQRMRHVANILNRHLPADYTRAVAVLLDLTNLLEAQDDRYSFAYMFMPDYIEQFGLEDFDTSIRAMERITRFASCEFAVRPFILHQPERMLAQMLHWSEHPDEGVRRFASEGCRPRLPWAMALPTLQKDPAPILPILENLKNDPSEFVRRSVANNLNDISKDNPTTAFALAKQWKGHSKNTDWIIKHGCRTLLKQGEPEVLALFGFGHSNNIEVDSFEVRTPVVSPHEPLEFTFTLRNTGQNAMPVRLEYGLYFRKANGSLSRKVFQISERHYAGGSATVVSRRQSFKPITTRKYYPGLHQVSLIVNGQEQAKASFELTGV
ncbi:MAG: DNA alkylation repair protein [Bacteroidetes bacterium]|nr:MAG: DNA alkylation repair protein [Bacteroidota bacterium]